MKCSSSEDPVAMILCFVDRVVIEYKECFKCEENTLGPASKGTRTNRMFCSLLLACLYGVAAEQPCTEEKQTAEY